MDYLVRRCTAMYYLFNRTIRAESKSVFFLFLVMCPTSISSPSEWCFLCSEKVED